MAAPDHRRPIATTRERSRLAVAILRETSDDS